MSVKHLSDDDIQSYLDSEKKDKDVTYHIENCEFCQKSIAAYEILYSSLAVDSTVELSDDFVSHTMQVIRDDSAIDESSASMYVFSIGGAVIALVTLGYIIGFQTMFQFLGLTTFVQTIFSLEIVNEFSGILTKNQTFWNTLGFAAVILLFFSLVEKILDKTKFGKLHTFSI